MDAWRTIETTQELQEQIESEIATLVYFSHQSCNVCKALKPKLATMYAERFPKVELCYVDTERSPEVSAQHQIFAVPTFILFFEGRETIREGRNVSLELYMAQVERPYRMLLEEES